MNKILSAAFITALLVFNASAQSPSSSQTSGPTMVLTGVVYDINGAVIVNGTRVVAESGDAGRRETSTNEEGVYKFVLPLSTYKIKVSAPGFCPRQIEDFILVNSTHGKMSLDFVLEVAGPCKQEKITEEEPKRRTKKKSSPIIIIERKHNVRTDG
jgi:hypothetical protein